jgi:hypothetical protein
VSHLADTARIDLIGTLDHEKARRRRQAGIGAYRRAFHAPVDCRSWPAPGEDEAVQLSGVLRALACALAVPARHAVRAANWLVYAAFPLSREAAAISDAVTLCSRAPDTS